MTWCSSCRSISPSSEEAPKRKRSGWSQRSPRDASGFPFDQRQPEPFLGAEVVVHQSVVHPGVRRDPLHAGALAAELLAAGEQRIGTAILVGAVDRVESLARGGFVERRVDFPPHGTGGQKAR